MKILSFGEILWDCYPEKKYIGGAPLNFAAHSAKLDNEVYMLSALGRDSLGCAAKEYLEKYNIFTDYVVFSESKPTGKCVVTLDENSVPSYDLVDDTAYDYISCDDVPNSFDVLYFGTLALRHEFNCISLQRLLERNTFKEIFVDVNIRQPYFSEETVDFAVKNATILKISLEELSIVSEMTHVQYSGDFKDFARMLADKYTNLEMIVITLGADGGYCYDCVGDEDYCSHSKKVKVVSTVGAGDSFSAAFLSEYQHTNDLRLSMDYATELAGFVVSCFDAVPDYDID